jgi:hypothetical protein
VYCVYAGIALLIMSVVEGIVFVSRTLLGKVR